MTPELERRLLILDADLNTALDRMARSVGQRTRVDRL
jgi:hypothetical protein